MESSIPNSSTSSAKCCIDYEMDSSNEDIDQQVLREAGEQTISAEWSATVSALNSSDTTSSNSYINIETLKECCANPSDTLKDKEDFIVFESSSTVVNISKFNANDTKNYSECKTTAFQKKHKPLSQNVSRCFENILDDDSQMEITQNSICLNRFQKRKRLIPPNDEEFIEINNSNYSESNSVEISMMKSPKFSFSRKKKDQFEIPDYNLSATDSDSIADDTNISKKKENTSNYSLVVNDSSNNMKNVSKTEVFTHKFSIKTIGVSDSIFENVINNSSTISDITLNYKKTSLNETALSNINNTSVFSKMDLSNLNHTYNIPNNTNSTFVKASVAGDASISKVKENNDFKKPSNSSLVVNDNSNNIMDVSKTEVFTDKFSRKTIDVTHSVFDNIINNSSILSDMTLNNKKTSLNETALSNINNTSVFSKMDLSNLNHTYNIPNNTNSTFVKVSIASDASISKVKENNDFKKPSNSSLVVNDNSNNTMDVSKTEVFTHKFSRKLIDVTHSVFDNIIDGSSMTSSIPLNNKMSPIETTVLNVNNTPGFSTINVSDLNRTYDVHMNNNTTLLDAFVEHDKSMSETPILLQNNRSKSFHLQPLKFNFSNKFGRHSLSLQENHPSFDGVKKHNISLNTDFIKNTEENSNNSPKSANNSNVNLKSHSHIPIIQEIPPLDPFLISALNQEQLKSNHSISSNSKNEDLLLSDATTKSLGSNEFQKNQSKNSMSSTSSNEGLTLLNSTIGLLGSCSSSKTQSRFLTSKQSKRSTSNDDTTNLTIESVDSNELENDQSKHSISSNLSDEGLTLTNSTTGFSEKRSSSRNKSSKHSTSNVSNNDSLMSLNDSTEISVYSRPSRNQSKHSTSVISNNDSLTLLNTTMESLKSNESQKTQSKRSLSPSSCNESLKSTNSTTEFSGRRSSSRNKSASSKLSTSITSNNDSIGVSVGGRSSRNQSKHSTSVISNNDSLTLLNTSMESLKSNESQKTQSKRSLSPTSYNENLKSTNSANGFSGRRSSSRNKSASSKLTTNIISNNDSTVISVGGRSSRNQSKHSTSVISNNDSLTLLNSTMESLKSNESQKTQSKRSISPTSYNENLKSTNSTSGFSVKRSSSRSKSTSTSSEHSTSVISNNDSLTSLNHSTEISVGSISSSSRNKSSSTPSKHSTSVISNNDSLTVLNTTMESLKGNESQKTQSKRSISPTSYNENLKSTNLTTGFSGRRSSSRNKTTSSKHSISVISNNDNSTLLNAAPGISGSGRLSRNQSKHSTSVISNNDSLTVLNTTMGSLKSNKSQKTSSKRSISPTSYNEGLKSTNSTTGFSRRRSSSRNKSSLLTSKHSTSVISNDESLTSLNAATEISVRRSSRNQSKNSTSVISNNDSLPLLNDANMGLFENNKSPKPQLTSPTTINIENLETLNTTTEPSKQNVLSMNGSTSKHSSSIISGRTSVNAIILEDGMNVSKISTRSSKQKSRCLSNVEPVTSIIIDGLSNVDGLMIKNTSTGPLKHKVLSLHQSNSSPNISINKFSNELILDEDTNNTNKMYDSSSKQKNKSYDNIEQIMPNIIDGPLTENRPSNTRVLRSSLNINANKSLLTKSLMSKNNVNNLSVCSTRTSKNMVNFNNNSFGNNSDNSLFWTTLPDESTNISSTQNVNMNTFQTPKRNKLSIAENIVNTIKIMSTNNQKSSHPGAFELDDHNDGPLTRSFVTRSYNRSPSILTLVFGGQKISESTSSLPQSSSEIIFDQSQVEENVKQKFKSLYKKESWITKRLYKFLIIKLQPNYNIYSVKYAEKFVKYLAQLLKQIHNDQVNLQLCTDMLRYHMARYHIIKNTFDYLGFLTDYIPMTYYKKLVPGWNLETSAVKFDPQKYYIPLMDDEEFLNYIMEHLNEA